MCLFLLVSTDIFEDFVSPVTAAATLLHTAVSKRKQVLDPTMVFCVHLLNIPAEQRDPRQKDGALHMIGTLADVLIKVLFFTSTFFVCIYCSPTRSVWKHPVLVQGARKNGCFRRITYSPTNQIKWKVSPRDNISYFSYQVCWAYKTPYSFKSSSPNPPSIRIVVQITPLVRKIPWMPLRP